jgi:hypothetical protein
MNIRGRGRSGQMLDVYGVALDCIAQYEENEGAELTAAAGGGKEEEEDAES